MWFREINRYQVLSDLARNKNIHQSITVQVRKLAFSTYESNTAKAMATW